MQLPFPNLFRRFTINPVALREMRQMSRNKIVSSGLIAFLFIQLAAVMITVASESDSGAVSLAAKGVGQNVAMTVCVLLDIVALGAIPLFFAIRLTLEKSADNMDLQFATGLKPAQFADGKIAAALVLLLLCASATAPFLMLAYILRGMDAGETFAIIGSVIFWSALITCFGVFVASLNLPKALRFIIMAGAGAFFMWLSLDNPLYFPADDLPFVFLKEWDFAWPIGLAILSLCAVFRSAAAANLAPPHTNGQLPLRRVIVIVWALWGALAVWWSLKKDEPFVFIWFMFSAFFIGGLFMLATVSAQTGPSRRVASEVSPNRWRRRLQYPFFTGSESGVCYALLLLFLTALTSFCVMYAHPMKKYFLSNDYHRFVYCMLVWGVCYPAAFMITMRLIWQWFSHRFCNRKFVGFFGALWMILASILPYLLTMGSDDQAAAAYWHGNIVAAILAMDHYDLHITSFHAIFSAVWLLIELLCYSPTVLKSFKRFRANPHTPSLRKSEAIEAIQ